MPTATLTSKGQVTIPLAVRNVLGLHAGSKLDFIRDEDSFKLIPVASGRVLSLKGRFAGRVSKPVSVRHERRDRHGGVILESVRQEPQGMMELDTNVLVRYLAQDDV